MIARLKAWGYQIELLSGDRAATVEAVAGELGIEDWRAACSPAEKCQRLDALQAEGRKTLMIGDGLNDAPALAAALVSVSPSSAVDISQTAADAVFQGETLAPVLELLEVARRSEILVKQNFGLAFRLQPARAAGGGARPGDAADRRGVHVGLLAAGHRQRAAPGSGRRPMSGLLYLIPVALFLGLLGLGAFLWSLRSGQFDDLDGAAHRILLDDDRDDDDRPERPGA